MVAASAASSYSVDSANRLAEILLVLDEVRRRLDRSRRCSACHSSSIGRKAGPDDRAAQERLQWFVAVDDRLRVLGHRRRVVGHLLGGERVLARAVDPGDRRCPCRVGLHAVPLRHLVRAPRRPDGRQRQQQHRRHLDDAVDLDRAAALLVLPRRRRHSESPCGSSRTAATSDSPCARRAAACSPPTPTDLGGEHRRNVLTAVPLLQQVVPCLDLAVAEQLIVVERFVVGEQCGVVLHASPAHHGAARSRVRVRHRPGSSPGRPRRPGRDRPRAG